jgi:D-erythro-7,8-dihydroneopterin triphosphate epimerase
VDRIFIRDLRVRSIVGINEWEKTRKQDILLNVTLHLDLTKAGQSDDIGDTLDYKKLKDQIVAHVEETGFALIERVAEDVARLGLADRRVAQVDVTVDKPGALRFARSVAVEITRVPARADA